MTRKDLLDAGHRNMTAFYAESAHWGHGGVVHEEDGIFCYASSTSFPLLLNGVIRTNQRTPPARLIEHALGFFGARHCGFTIWSRTGLDEDIAKAAEGLGLAPVAETPQMIVSARLPDRPSPPGVELRRITSVEEVAAFADMNGEAYSTYGMPPQVLQQAFNAPERLLGSHVYAVIAWVGSEAAAGALTFLSHGIAGVYWVGTREKYRKRGLAEAVTRSVTNAAFDRGARANTLQASPMGDPIYRRMGYEEVYRYRLYAKTEEV